VHFEEESFWKALTNPILFLTEEKHGCFFFDSIKKNFHPQKKMELPSGEAVKSRRCKELVEDFLLEHNFGKDTTIVAMGGGSLLDLAGFVASTYARGINLVFIPTTLLAMVDACFGGKTSLNVNGIKNAIGTFYPAKHILIATRFLSTLPWEQKQGAFCEILKYALIYDEEFFVFLQKNKTLWQSQDPDFIQTLIKQSLEIKKAVVQKDPQEKLGLRRILNFGHTIGHGLESLFSYTVSHGACVGVGMLIEAHISRQMGLLLQKELEAITALWKDYELGANFPVFSYEQISPFLLFDKKNEGKSPRFVLLSRIGKVQEFDGTYCSQVPKECVQKAIDWFHAL
jgi:3-dehydroquinate synthase